MDSSTSPTTTPPPEEATLPLETPISGECTQTFEPPQPTATGNLAPKEYPSYPSTLTVRTAESYAADYELAVTHNQILSRANENTTVELETKVLSRLTESVGDGYLIGVRYSGYTEEETADGTIIADYWGDLVYYLTPEYALRVKPEGHHYEPLSEVESLQSVNYSSPYTETQTIYCRSDS